MLGYLNRAVPLEQVDDEDFVNLVTDIRRFAIEELGLNQSKNYTTYVELDRNYLANIVSASAKDSFARHEWKFPIVGSVPYKGFFKIEDAQKERAKLEKKDLDVWVRRVDGFSTLGWFKDPLYSYMRYYSPYRLADLIIHELVHSTVFLKGHVQFNEELAEFIGTEGARLYILSRYGENHSTDNEYQKYVGFIQELIAKLETLYSSDLDRTEKLAEKQRIISGEQRRFEDEYETHFSGDNFRSFSAMPVNNAYLELFRLYHTPDNFYNDLYEQSGRDLPAFVAAAKTLNRKTSPRQQLEQILLK